MQVDDMCDMYAYVFKGIVNISEEWKRIRKCFEVSVSVFAKSMQCLQKYPHIFKMYLKIFRRVLWSGIADECECRWGNKCKWMICKSVEAQRNWNNTSTNEWFVYNSKNSQLEINK